MWLIIAAVVVLWLLHGKKSRIKAAPSERTADSVTETILECASCGVHIPRSEAVIGTDGAVFCSQDHRIRHTGT
ncbi:MAG: hypothetical protein H7315_12510 [Herminiimonas sp.]|nr:hypothetical protein [Herminiimonas sp.]